MSNYATRLPFRPVWRIESIPGRDHRGPLDVAAFPSDCAATKIGYNLVLDASDRRAKAVERRDGTEDSECRLKQHIEFTSTTENGRAHVRPPVTNAHLVSRLLIEKKKTKQTHSN